MIEQRPNRPRSVHILPEGLSKSEELDYLARKYNQDAETNLQVESELIRLLLENEWLKSAVAAVGDGTLVEVGHYGGSFLAAISQKYAEDLKHALVLGIDKGNHTNIPEPMAFLNSTEEKLLAEDNNRILNSEQITSLRNNPKALVWQHRNLKNTFALYGTTLAEAIKPSAKIDLMVTKFMMGYLTNDAILKHLEWNFFPRAESVFMIDYVGICRFAQTKVPSPQTIAAAMSDKDVVYSQGNNHFILYATTPDHTPPQ